MSNTVGIGISIPKKESFDKVTGSAKYNDDIIPKGILHGKLLTSPHAHAIIKSIDISEASNFPGVKAVVTGQYYPSLCGALIEDRPPLAINRVRYYGEPIAVVIAAEEQIAMRALKLIKVEYEPIKVVNSISDALATDAILIHENLSQYKTSVDNVYPIANTNICHHMKIRKGNISEGFAQSDVVVEAEYSMPQSDHIAMETRNVRAQILPSGQVIIYTSTQDPYSIPKLINRYFNVPEGNVIVKVPFVGGAFGGKAAIQLELIAYLASKAVGGSMVRLSNSREEDIKTSPCKIGLEAKLKIGATKDGIIKAFEATYMVDCGAYAGIGPRMVKAICIDCTGPYNIENVYCNSLGVYTNHTYVTSFRGFGHSSSVFCIERTIDKLAKTLNMDPLELRIKNAILPGQLFPTQDKVTLSNSGDLVACLTRIKHLTNWNKDNIVESSGSMIKAKGISCLWKRPDSPTDSISSVLLTFNSDGSININCGAVEIGPGMKTTAAQILAEKMKMDVSKIHVFMDVDTQVSPMHWKTVASMTTFMLGRAIIKAADDLITQLKSVAAVIMKCPPEDLDVAEEKVFFKDDSQTYTSFKDLVHGYKYPEGVGIEGPMLGKGSYMMRGLTILDKETGKGKPGPSCTMGVQVVEIEYDPREYTYRVLKVTTVMDVGKVINPKNAFGLINGGVNMGLGLATREAFVYDSDGIIQTTTLRTYKPLRFGENPNYVVDFIETPQVDGPFGARGLGEHGILGIPPAFANAISSAAGTEFDTIPITPEVIWKAKTGGKYDTL